MKFAMLEMLLRPPSGFEAVVRAHFRCNKGELCMGLTDFSDKVLRVCEQWTREAAPDAAERLRDCQAKIAAQLQLL